MSTRAVTWGIAQRSLMLIPRVPSTFIPSLVMPVFFVVSLSGAFAGIATLRGFPAQQMLDWILPMSTLQGCAFAGITTGLGVARDMENGFFDRFASSPAPRIALLAGPLLASMLRATFPLVLLTTIGLLSGVNMPGGVLGVALLWVAGFSVALIAGEWAVGMALRTRSTQSAPLIQSALFLAFFLAPAQMPLDLMTGWVHAVARVNPMTNVLTLARQGFIGDVTWDVTWPGLVALAGMAAVLGLFAYRGIRKAAP